MLLPLHDIIPTHVLETIEGKRQKKRQKKTVLYSRKTSRSLASHTYHNHRYSYSYLFTLAYTPHSLVHNKNSNKGRSNYAPLSKCKFKSRSVIDAEIEIEIRNTRGPRVGILPFFVLSPPLITQPIPSYIFLLSFGPNACLWFLRRTTYFFFITVVALVFRGRLEVCLFFDLRELISNSVLCRDCTYIPRTMGIVTLVGDDKSIDMVVYIYTFVISFF